MSPETALLTSMFPFCKAKSPLIIAAPMRTVSGLPLAMAVSDAGGLGFYSAGYDLASLSDTLAYARKLYNLPLHTSESDLPPTSTEILPIGVGIIVWKAQIADALAAITTHRPCAVWLFAALDAHELDDWIEAIKIRAPWVKMFVQIGSVRELELLMTGKAGEMVDVVVAQGVADAGGHGRTRGASIMSLVPEFVDFIKELRARGVQMQKVLPVVAAGAIMDGRGVVAALALGANGVALGTRFIATPESEAPEGFKKYLINTADGGQNTVRTRIYDTLRGTGGWPQEYNARAVVNNTFISHELQMCEMKNKALYEKAVEEEDWTRLTMFAGTGVGLINRIQPAAEILESMRAETVNILNGMVGGGE